MTGYNYTGFAADTYNLDAPDCPRPGTKAPDFTARTTEGQTRRLLDFDGRFLVLETGSITCPLFQSRRQTMTRVVMANPDVSFAILYTREAHPGTLITAHKTLKEKQNSAQRLKEEDREGRTILVDGLEGAAHRAYGGFPNAVFIISKSGCIVFQADWNNPRATAKALGQLKAGRPARVRSFFVPATPAVGLKVLARAGAGSKSDFFRALPKLFWKNAVKRNILTLFHRTPAVSPDAGC